MLLRELLQGLDCTLYDISETCEITRPFSDSRGAVSGGLFVCLEGGETDGALYVCEAAERGAAAVVSRRREEGIPTVVVNDTRYALAHIWNNFYKRPARNMRLFGITGTNGKTSTAAFLSACLAKDARKVGVIGTLGCFAEGERVEVGASEKMNVAAAMTTPDPQYLYGALALFRKKGITDCVMEVSSHAVSLRKTDPLSFSFGIFTNLSPEHLDFHGSMEEYFRVKSGFVARCERRIVNRDDPECRRFCASVPSVAVGRDDAFDIRIGTGSVSYRLKSAPSVEICSSVGGEFTLYNTLLAVTAAKAAGVAYEVSAQAISSVAAVRGRLERVARADECGFDLIIDYAHTPAALEAVLRHLRACTSGKLICVFGCGGERDRKKRPLMGRAAETYADAVIVTGDNPRCEEPLGIIRDIISGMKKDNSVVIPDRKEAIFCAVAMANRGDTVLLAGKGHENYEIVGEKKRPFDERAVVEEAIALKNGK